MKTLGQRINELRESQNMSLRELSGNLKGFSAAHLSDIERGRRHPSKDLLGKLATVFEVDVADLERYDTRPAMRELKQRVERDPALGLKLRGVLDERAEVYGSRDESVASAIPQEDSIAAEMIVRLVASGLVTLYMQFERTGEPPQANYSRQLQRGLDKLVALRLTHGKPPPQSIPDLLALCEQPFRAWSFDQLPEDVHPDDALLCNGQPTYFCEEYARTDHDLEAALSEERFMRKVFFACASVPSEVYTRLREQLVKTPVMTEAEFIRSYTKPPLNQVAELLKEAYEEAPLFLSHKGFFCCCNECGNLLMYDAKQGWICQDESCPVERVREERALRKLPVNEENRVYQLTHPLRRYVAAPGRVELKLRDEMVKLGRNASRFEVELFPNMDAYDLRVIFPDRETWAVDVKDWANPYRLAANVKAFRTTPPWDRAFFVFPDRHKAVRRNYVEAFRNSCPYVDERTGAMFVSDFITAARRKLRGGK
jgi:transcriptional regulator with XRE-family HTH domain